MEVLIYIGLLCVSWLFSTGASSIQQLKKAIGLDNKSVVKNIWMVIIRELINCAMCSGFWIGLTYYLWFEHSSPFLMACMVCVGAIPFEFLISTFISNTKR